MPPRLRQAQTDRIIAQEWPHSVFADLSLKRISLTADSVAFIKICHAEPDEA